MIKGSSINSFIGIYGYGPLCRNHLRPKGSSVNSFIMPSRKPRHSGVDELKPLKMFTPQSGVHFREPRLQPWVSIGIRSENGHIMIITFAVLATVLFIVLFLVAGSQIYNTNTSYSANTETASNLAEAGVDKAIASLNELGESYTGDSEISLGNGSFSVTITSKDSKTKIIESTGYIPSKSNPKVKKTVKITASKGTGTAFNYGVQVGEGGLEMDKETQIIGSIYSNGNITIDQDSIITGDAYVAGGTAPSSDQSTECSEVNCNDYIFGKTVSGENRLDIAQSFQPSTSGILNKVALKLKKFGSPPNLTVRIMGDSSGKPNKSNVLASGTLSANLVTSQYSFVEVTLSSPPSLNANSPYWIMIDTSSDTNNYWSWSNDLAQGYTRGSPKYSPNWNASSPTWTSINGDLAFKTYMGGVATYIQGASDVTIGGDAHANTLRDLEITGGAYYQASSNITAGSLHPNSTDPSSQSMPISEANLSSWKTEAASKGVYSGNITNCPSSLPAGKYVGFITLPSDCTVKVGAPIWVTGDFTMHDNATIKLDPAFGQASGVFIVDNFINLAKDDRILGSGTEGSYLILISTFNSKDDPGSRVAINVSKEGNSGVLYSNLGIISIAKENHMTSVTGWKLKLQKEVTVEYDDGLAGTFFNFGPSGSYSLIKGTYQIK